MTDREIGYQHTGRSFASPFRCRRYAGGMNRRWEERGVRADDGYRVKVQA
ncbi:MAG: hypothetical protein OXC31_24895 [Spirochaetaceae bacterium]|nr:hypothetical protein [Spirochaetaceae bacterium]